eukprot:15485639-Alexandrium_andersonii.AAC.1
MKIVKNDAHSSDFEISEFPVQATSCSASGALAGPLHRQILHLREKQDIIQPWGALGSDVEGVSWPAQFKLRTPGA